MQIIPIDKYFQNSNAEFKLLTGDGDFVQDV